MKNTQSLLAKHGKVNLRTGWEAVGVNGDNITISPHHLIGGGFLLLFRKFNADNSNNGFTCNILIFELDNIIVVYGRK